VACGLSYGGLGVLLSGLELSTANDTVACRRTVSEREFNCVCGGKQQ